MEFDHDDERRAVEEDRLSSLPDELIHKILSSFDVKFAVKTCLLSSRWKLLWTSVPCLNFSSWKFKTLPDFTKFATFVLSQRNHQAKVSSVEVNFNGAANEVLLRDIENYAFSHNVQQLTFLTWPGYDLYEPPFILTSQSLKHFTFISHHESASITIRTPLNFPALTTLHLCGMVLCRDLFSKCVNLKNFTLENFFVEAVEVFDIITPQLSNLILIRGRCYAKVMNLIAPQLENLTIDNCSIKHLDAPPGLSSWFYRGDHHPPLSKDRLRSLKEITIRLSMLRPFTVPYKEEDARKIINMLKELHSARYLTLDANMVECISSFPDLLSHYPSPFTNLICLTIDSFMRKGACEDKMSTQVRNFFLESSPSATLVMKLPEVLLSERRLHNTFHESV